MRKTKNDHSSQFLVLIQEWWRTVRCSSSTTQLYSLFTVAFDSAAPTLDAGCLRAFARTVRFTLPVPSIHTTRVTVGSQWRGRTVRSAPRAQTHRHSLTVGNPVASLDNSTATSKNGSYRNVRFGFLACCCILVCPTYSLIGQFGNSFRFVAMRGASQKQKGKKREKEKKKHKSISVNNQFFFIFFRKRN